MTGSYSGLFRSKSFGQLGNGGSIMTSRDDGWDLRDSEGWYRYRRCRPITIRDLVLPRRNKGFIAWPGGLEETRHTLAFIGDGRRFHMQENWQAHEESIDTTKESWVYLLGPRIDRGGAWIR